MRAVAAAATVWAAAVLLCPLLPKNAGWVAALPYLAGSLVCHQIPERSFQLAGSQLPVCARCTGLYAGAALGLVAWAAVGWRRETAWSHRSALSALVVTGAPTALTLAMAFLGLGDPPNVSRAMLALPLGAIAGAVVGAVITDHLK